MTPLGYIALFLLTIAGAGIIILAVSLFRNPWGKPKDEHETMYNRRQ